MTCTATPPTVVHTPATSFTIDTVKVGAIVKPAVKKPVQKPVGGTALGATTEQLLAQEESLFAEVIDGVVVRVIVISQETLNTGKWGDPKNWIQTSAKGTIRKNYAGMGYEYDKTIDAFIPPKSPDETIFNSTKALWGAPVVASVVHDASFYSASSTTL